MPVTDPNKARLILDARLKLDAALSPNVTQPEDTLALRLGGVQDSSLSSVRKQATVTALPAFVRAGFGETTAGLISELAGHPAISEEEREKLGALEQIGAGAIGMLADPVTYISFGIGGSLAKVALKQTIRRGAKLVVQESVSKGIKTGVGMGLHEATKEGVRSNIEGRPYELGRVGGMTALGMVAGGFGGALLPIAGKVASIGAETLGFAAGQGPIMEGRLPRVDDFIGAAGMTVGVEGSQLLGKALFKLSRGMRLSSSEKLRVTKSSETERLKILEEARNRFDADPVNAAKIQKVKAEAEAKAGKMMPDRPPETMTESREDYITRVIGNRKQVTEAEYLQKKQELINEWNEANKETIAYGIPKAGSKEFPVSSDPLRAAIEERASVALARGLNGKKQAFVSDGLKDLTIVKEPVIRKMYDDVNAEYDRALSELHSGDYSQARAGLAEDLARPKLRGIEAARETYALDQTSRVRVDAGGAKPTVEVSEVSGGFDGSRVSSYLKKWFLPQGNLPKEVYEAKLKATGAVRAEMVELEYNLKEFNRAAKRLALTDADEININKVLRNEAQPELIPSELRPIIDKIRTHVNGLSERMIHNGLAEGDLAITFLNNKGHYLTRAYRAFEKNSGWAKRMEDLDPTIVNRYISWVKRERPGLRDDQIEAEINILLNPSANDTPLSVLANAKIGRKNLGITQKKEDIPVEIRAILGEYTGAMESYAKSIEKMANLALNHEFLTQVRDAGMGKYFFAAKDAHGEFSRPIASEGSKSYSPLNGLVTTPEIAEAFKAYDDVGGANNFVWDAILRANAMAKMSKTVFSPTTHVRNFSGNAMFGVSQGWLTRGGKTKAVGEAIKALSSDWSGRGSQGVKDYVKELTERRVIGDSARAGDLAAMLDDLSNQTLTRWTDVAGGKQLKAATRKVIKAYGSEDDFWKIVSYEVEKRSYTKAYGDVWTSDQIKTKAAQLTRELFPTYSETPEFVKQMRKVPFTAPFITFPYQVGRTAYYTFKTIAEESRDSRTRGIAAHRIGGVLTAGVAVGAATATTRAMLGVDGQDDMDNRRFLPPWSKDSNIAYVGHDAKGNLKYIDLSYTDPYQYLRKSAINFVAGMKNDKGIAQSAFDAFLVALKPLTDDELLWGATKQAIKNQSQTGARIYNEDLDGWDRLSAQMEYVTKTVFEPGGITSARKINKSEDRPQEIMAVLSGTRRSALDIPKALSFKARDFKEHMKNAESDVTQTISSRGKVSDYEIASAYVEADRGRRKWFNEMVDDVDAAKRQGVDEAQIKRILLNSGLSKKYVGMVMDNDYRIYEVSPEYSKGLQERAARGDYLSKEEVKRRLSR